MTRLLPLALLFVLAACGGEGTCDDDLPGPNERAYIEGPDEARGCETANPTSGTSVVCLNADPESGECCGDVAYALVCHCGSWVCPEGTRLVRECTGICGGP